MSNALTTYNSEDYQGYFGKIPSNGDFVSKGLPRSFREPWDIWLQSMISTSKKELGDDWEQFYLTSPVYRFVLSAGICGSQTWIGMMIPCVDQVGRYYPMTICRSLPNHPNPLIAITENEVWFSATEALILSCLDDDFSLVDFDNKIKHLTLTKDENQDATSVRRIIQQHPKNAWRMTSAKPDFSEMSPFLINALLEKFCLSYSVWWTTGSNIILPSTIITQGLPPVSGGASALLDGKWDQGGWESTHTLFRFSS
jgi:type VI secretion system protein ImpM